MAGAYKRALGAAAVVWLAASAVSAQTFARADDGLPVQPSEAATALAQGPVVARLPAGGEVQVLGLRLASHGGATLYVAASTEFLTFAAIDGDARVGRLDLRPGEAAVVVLRSGKIEKLAFDAARLAASAPPGIASEFQAKLPAIAHDQARRRFWGLLVPTGVNAQAPGSPALEATRRTYLMSAALIDLRARSGRDPAALRTLTAQRFVEALAARDDATVAALIDPKPFLAAGRAWSGARDAYARSMIAGPLPSSLAQASVSPGSDGTFNVQASGAAYVLATVDRDGASFISRLEPR